MEQILAAAEQVFAERGFDGSRTRDIAARAGVNVSTLHYHYRSKEELYAAVIRSVIGQVRLRIVAAIREPGLDPVMRVAKFIESHFEVVASRPYFPRLLVDAMVHAPDIVRDIAHDTAAPLLETLLPVLREARGSGAFRWKVNLPDAILSVIGMNVIYFLAQPLVEAILGEDSYSPGRLQARKEAVLDLVLNGVLAREEEGRLPPDSEDDPAAPGPEEASRARGARP